MTTKELKAKTAWNIARSFRGSSMHLMSFWNAPDALAMRTIPGIVCGAFAVELYLKCLLVLDGTEVREHAPSELFAALKPDTRKHVAKFFPTSSEGDVKRILTGLDGAFVGWRYVYEGRKNHIDHGVLDTAFESLERAILDLHPDWPSGPA
jgi:hypothetical protein